MCRDLSLVIINRRVEASCLQLVQMRSLVDYQSDNSKAIKREELREVVRNIEVGYFVTERSRFNFHRWRKQYQAKKDLNDYVNMKTV